MGQLEGALAVVTGGSQGIGCAIAERFVAEGADVVITGRRKDVLDEAVAALGPRATGVPGRRGLAGRPRHADGRPCAASADRSTSWSPTPAAGSEAPLAAHDARTCSTGVAGLNVRGTFFTVQKALPLLADGARVVLVSSISGSNGDAGPRHLQREQGRRPVLRPDVDQRPARARASGSTP